MQLRTLSSDFRRFRLFPTDFGRDRVVLHAIVQFLRLLSKFRRYHPISDAFVRFRMFSSDLESYQASLRFRMLYYNFGRFRLFSVEPVRFRTLYVIGNRSRRWLVSGAFSRQPSAELALKQHSEHCCVTYTMNPSQDTFVLQRCIFISTPSSF